MSFIPYYLLDVYQKKIVMSENSFTCIILARGGSKSIKNKNIVKIKKKPLIYYSLNAANKSKYLKKIYVSTDSILISKKVKNLNFSKVEVIARTKKNSSDTSSSESAIAESLNYINSKYIIFIQPTNIFVTTKIINSAIEKFIKNNYDSLLSVIQGKNFAWISNKDKFVPVNYEINKRPLRQNKKNDYFIENGSFYIFSTNGFKKYKNRLFGKIGYYQMSDLSYFDIDEYSDLNIVKKLKK